VTPEGVQILLDSTSYVTVGQIMKIIERLECEYEVKLPYGPKPTETDDYSQFEIAVDFHSNIK
jgi:hypothetical protein